MLTITAIGLLGGTFDPFHNGHLQLATAIHAQLQLKEIRLIPSAQPLLRDPPIAAAEQRLAMAKIAAQDYPWLKVDDREIKRGGVSYTIDTLTSFRREMPDTPLCFIMSMDQFLQFDRWQSWEQIPALAHLIVASRPAYLPNFNAPLQTLVDQRCTDKMHLLHETPAGLIFFQQIPAITIAGTQIRAWFKAGENIQDLVPEKIREYIDEQGLYI